MQGVEIKLRSGQSWLPLLEDKSLIVPENCTLDELKLSVSQHLGNTPSANDIVLAKADGQALVLLEGALKEERELFVFFFQNLACSASG